MKNGETRKKWCVRGGAVRLGGGGREMAMRLKMRMRKRMRKRMIR